MFQTKSMMAILGLMVVLVCGSTARAALSDAEIAQLTAGFESRRDAALDYQLTYFLSHKSKPEAGAGREMGYRYCLIAMGGLYLNKETEQANQAVLDLCGYLQSDPAKMDEIYWWGLDACRIYELFNRDSKYLPGRLSEPAQAALCELLWKWASPSKGERGFPIDTFTSPERIWEVWFSENHEIMRNIMAWNSARILSQSAQYRDRKYEDGLAAAEHLGKWSEHLKQYFAERAKRGLFLETSSPVYGKFTLHGIYNVYDFADDPALAKQARQFLDLWWADWALQQVEGVRGGAKRRCYFGNYSIYGTLQPEYTFGWYYLGIGQPGDKPYPKSVGLGADQRHTALCAATSTYRLPAVIMDLALDLQGRGSYEYIARRPGRNLVPSPNLHLGDPARHLKVKPVFIVDPDISGSVDYTYVTPDYVLGSYRVPMSTENDLVALHSMAIWQGIIFTGNPNARIYPQCKAVEVYGSDRANYNQHRNVQYKQTLIVQKNPASLYAMEMRVFFAKDGLTRTEDSSWVFAESPSAYAAVHVVDGGYVWDDDNWLRCNKDYSPVIFEAGTKSEYKELASFKAAVLANPVKFDGKVLEYTGLSKKCLTLFARSEKDPQIDSVPLDYAPRQTFSSPYMLEDWTSGIVTITKDGRRLVLNFN